MNLKLVSLNVERSLHLDRCIPFLTHEAADVVCIQEIMERDIALFESAIGAKCSFAGMAHHESHYEQGVQGIGLFSRVPLRDVVVTPYVDVPEPLPVYEPTTAERKRATQRYVLLSARIGVGEDEIHLATTHFTWTPDGLPDTYQKEDIVRLLAILNELRVDLIVGDFNAPRGGEIFAQFAARYTDTIPPHYTTSLDLELHRAVRAGKVHEIDHKMVDGLFINDRVIADRVTLVTGVSDHAAIVAHLSTTATKE